MTCELAYSEQGPPGAEPLVLSNSLGTTRAMWDPQVRALPPDPVRHARARRLTRAARSLPDRGPRRRRVGAARPARDRARLVLRPFDWAPYRDMAPSPTAASAAAAWG